LGSKERNPVFFFVANAGAAPTRDPADMLTRVLSNGRYLTLVRGDGTGYSSAGDLALTAWSPDANATARGFTFYLRESTSQADSAELLSLHEGAVFDAASCTFRRTVRGLETELEILVLPRDPAEIRRIRLRNASAGTRVVEVASFLEPVLERRATFAAHPVFSKLFLQTEYQREQRSLLVRRRSREPGTAFPWLVHALLTPADHAFETDRARFLGRGGARERPLALRAAPPPGTTGNVLDPCASFRTVVVLDPGDERELGFLLGVGNDRAACIDLVTRAGAHPIELLAEARAETRARDHRAGLPTDRLQHAHDLAGAILCGHPALRDAGPETLVFPDDLARIGLTLETPFVFVDLERTPTAVADLIALHSLWSSWGLPIELVVIGRIPEVRPRPHAGLHVFAREELTDRSIGSLASAAAYVVTGSPWAVDTAASPRPAGVGAAVERAPNPPATTIESGRRGTALVPRAGTVDPPAEGSVTFWNGTGGFAEDGRSYVLHLAWDETARTLRLPPQPWINVVANETFGFLVSETGAGTTWSGNSREHRLTPWENDPVLDPHTDAFLVRDEETGEEWSVLPGPMPAATTYEVRQGFGHSIFRHTFRGIDHESALFVAGRESARITRVTLTNRGTAPRVLLLSSHAKLALAGSSENGDRFVRTMEETETGVLLARTLVADDFAGRVAFATASVSIAHERVSAPERFQPGFSQAIRVVLEPKESMTISWILGESAGRDEALALARSLGSPGGVERAWQETRTFWDHFLSAVEVHTPSPAFDVLLNGWLAYQTLACRLWGRTAFYQSGGAFGFRDQLQDAVALLHYDPALAREQILRHAAHQFVEGDVLHWWHPPKSRGIRTRFADDLLWLPHLTASYVAMTGDASILHESAPLLRARALAADEDEALLLPELSGLETSVYDHCCRALDRSLAVGAHGLPLFGTGDWNDGMNRVGREGRGESVWMGFFLCETLRRFAPLCRSQGDDERAARYDAHRARVAVALEETAWDGQWYRRGYYDDGSPLGSHTSDECRIDALAQAWAVLSGVAPADRAACALDAVEEHLISDSEKLVRLLTPPFENTPHDPGYIKGYVAGVRENGGQYTHAALWVVQALAKARRNDRAMAVLELLNPIHHARRAEDVATYRVEPYVIAADVYGVPPHVGRGGWTWYTGSAGWMIRVALESVLGVRREGDSLVIDPCVPDEWSEYSVRLRIPSRSQSAPMDVEVRVRNPERRARRVVRASLDGAALPLDEGRCRVPLRWEGRTQRVEIELGGEPTS